MAMVKKSITVTDQQERWIQTQMATGNYGTDSELIREALREKQDREQEVEYIRAKLILAEQRLEKEGYSERSVKDIMQDVLKRKGIDAEIQTDTGSRRRSGKHFSFGVDTFGIEQAITYTLALEHRFEELGETPKLYMEVNEIRKGYRRSICGVHSIYYRIVGDMVEIMGIIGRQDPEKLR